MSFTLGGVDLDDEDSIEIVNDEHSPVKYSNAQQNQNKTKQQNKLKTKEEHPNKESTKLDLIYTLDQDDEPMHSTRSLKSLRTYGRSKTSNRTSHTTQHNNHNNNNHRNKDNNNHNTNSTSDGDTNHTMTTVPLTHDDPTPHTRHKRARSPDTDTAVTPVKKFRADEAQSFLEKVTERFRAPQTVITMPNKVTVSSEEKKRNNKRVSRDSTDRTKQPAKLGKDGSVFRAGSATQPLAVSDDVTPVKRAPVKHKSRATDQSRDEDSVEVVILNDESPQREIESPSHAFLDMTRDEHEKNSDEKNSDESSSSLDQSFDLFDSQPLTASRDSKIGALPRLALVCLQIDRMVVRDTDVKDAFQLRVKAHHLSVSEVSPSSPPIEIAISELVQVQYSALHRLIVLRLKTVPVSISGFWQNKSKDRPYLVLILAEELSDEHKRHLQSLLSTEQRRLDKYDDRKLKIDLVTEVYEQYIKGRQQGVDLTLSSDHVPLEIRGEIHHSDEARDDTEYHARDSDSPPRSTRILRSSRASVQSAEEIHAEIEHKRANVLCVWPKGARDSVSITELDLARLEPNEFLNDVIIDFYLMWIRDRIVPPKQRNNIYFYNSFFYNLLTRKSQGYNKVKKWTKHVNIFDYDYLVIPINQHFHWRVCIVYHPQRLLSTSTSDDAPYLIMLDSLQGSAGSVYRAIKEYLQKEWQDKQHDPDVTLDMTRLKTVMPKAPTQDNHYDCGIFVLQYVESFCINPVKSPMHITESWFSAKVIARKRREIRAIILKLAEEQGHSIGSTANKDHSNIDNT